MSGKHICCKWEGRCRMVDLCQGQMHSSPTLYELLWEEKTWSKRGATPLVNEQKTQTNKSAKWNKSKCFTLKLFLKTRRWNFSLREVSGNIYIEFKREASLNLMYMEKPHNAAEEYMCWISHRAFREHADKCRWRDRQTDWQADLVII